MNKEDNYLGFNWACDNGHIEILKYLCETFKDYEMIKSNNNMGFIHAQLNGHVEVVNYLL